MIQDFFNAAFPWIILGIGLAVVFTVEANKKKKK